VKTTTNRAFRKFDIYSHVQAGQPDTLLTVKQSLGQFIQSIPQKLPTICSKVAFKLSEAKETHVLEKLFLILNKSTSFYKI
jgi:hypothetical protein